MNIKYPHIKPKHGKWTRTCPKCNREIYYVYKYSLLFSERHNRICRSCANSKRNLKYNIPKIDGVWKKTCPSCNIEMMYSSKGLLIDSLNKNRICNKCAHKKYRTGKTYDEIYGKEKSTEIRKKQGKGKKGSAKFSKKMRIIAIKRIEERKGQCIPNYNPKSIFILEQKAKELGITDLQHAENDGEYRIKELGYTVDGYSPSKNTVIEYYENRHKKTVEKDEKRKQEIINHLSCKFIEIKEWELDD
jgi:hypothetical protein